MPIASDMQHWLNRNGAFEKRHALGERCETKPSGERQAGEWCEKARMVSNRAPNS